MATNLDYLLQELWRAYNSLPSTYLHNPRNFVTDEMNIPTNLAAKDVETDKYQVC
jgi:hypothetical protein